MRTFIAKVGFNGLTPAEGPERRNHFLMFGWILAWLNYHGLNIVSQEPDETRLHGMLKSTWIQKGTRSGSLIQSKSPMHNLGPRIFYNPSKMENKVHCPCSIHVLNDFEVFRGSLEIV